MNSAQHHHYLKQLGIIQYVPKNNASVESDDGDVIAETVIAPAINDVKTELKQSSETVHTSHIIETAIDKPITSNTDWFQLENQIKQCRSCDMHETRKQVVLGNGDKNARLLIVGEAPNAEEDKQGESFIGPTGDLLNSMLWAMGFSREQVFMTNTIKCKPTGDRKPGVKEIASCRGYLEHQIKLVQPTLVLAMGAVAAHSLLQTDMAVGKLRGRVHKLKDQDVSVLVTYHPAYLLRRPEEKAKSWTDLQQALTILNA